MRLAGAPQQAATLAADAAGILERDYGIDAGEVLSMNVDTVETVTGGIDAQSPDFAAAVDNWDTYAQKTFSAAFADSEGYMLSKRNPAVESATTLGYYADVTVLPKDGTTPETYYLTKRERFHGGGAANKDGEFKEYSVKAVIPAGTKTDDLLDPTGQYRLTGSVYSFVKGGSWNSSREDYAGWYGTGLLNPDEYEADNIHASFHLAQGGTLDNGFCFMVNQSEDTYTPVDNSGNPYNAKARSLSGYFITYSSHINTVRTLWRFDNWRLDNSFSAPNTLNQSTIWCYPRNDKWTTPGTSITSPFGETVTCLATWQNDAKDIDYDITCKEGNIKVLETQNGVTRTVADVNDSTYTKGTYGFWGNNCEQADESLVTNLNVEISKTYVKSFGDIVYEPTWTDGALHMLINIDTLADKTMLGSDGGTERGVICASLVRYRALMHDIRPISRKSFVFRSFSALFSGPRDARPDPFLKNAQFRASPPFPRLSRQPRKGPKTAKNLQNRGNSVHLRGRRDRGGRSSRVCCPFRPRLAGAACAPTTALAADAAGILERDYGIDAGEVLSMNVDTVETSGLDAQSPDFAAVVNSWEKYGQKTFMSCFADSDGFILSKRDPAVSSESTQGYYVDVTSLPSDGAIPEDYYLTKRIRSGGGVFSSYSVKTVIPKGTPTADLLDQGGNYRLAGSVYSYVVGGGGAGSRDDYAGWYGTGIFNPDEYDADNIHASFRLVQGGRLNEGFAFMVTQSEATYTPMNSSGTLYNGVQSRSLSGYFMNFSNHNNNGQNYRALWKFENWRLDNSFSAPNTMNATRIWCETYKDTHKEAWRNVGQTYTTQFGESVTCLATWQNESSNIDYDVTCRDGKIKIDATKDGVTTTVANVEDSTYTKGTYGFWGNNCEQAAESLVTNLNVEINKTKSFGDIVYEPNWTDGALHMLINIDTKADKTMLGSDGGGSRSLVVPRAPSASRPAPRGDRGNDLAAPDIAVAGKNSETVQQTTTLAADAAGILERDYGIDAGQVLSMNVDTVETITGGIESSSPDFAQVVNDPENWEPYAQKTYRACFADADGYILSRVVGTDSTKQGYYDDVTALPAEGAATTQPYYLVKMVRNSGGFFSSYSVKKTIPAGTTTAQLLDPNGAHKLNGSIYSYVTGGRSDGSRDDYAGWYGTALLNNNEYDADNISASFKLIKGGNLNEGFCFMVNKSSITDTVHYNGKDIVVPRLSGYFMSVCCHNTRAVRTLWRFDDYVLDQDSSPNAAGIWCAAGHAGQEKLWYAGNQHTFIPSQRSNAATKTTITQKPQTVTALATWIDDAQNVDYNVKADGKTIKVTRKDNGKETDPNAVGSVNKATDYGFPNLQTTTGVTFPNARDVEETVADIAITENANGTTSYYDSVSKKGSTVNAPNLAKGTYGFWGQNCEQGNQALITGLNVAIEKTIVKSFGDIVYEPNWTDGALHMLINIDTLADKTMLGSDGGTERGLGSEGD